MYAVIEKNYIKISVAEFYSMGWYERDQFLSKRDGHEFDHGQLEIDIHMKTGRWRKIWLGEKRKR